MRTHLGVEPVVDVPQLLEEIERVLRVQRLLLVLLEVLSRGLDVPLRRDHLFLKSAHVADVSLIAHLRLLRLRLGVLRFALQLRGAALDRLHRLVDAVGRLARGATRERAKGIA